MQLLHNYYVYHPDFLPGSQCQTLSQSYFQTQVMFWQSNNHPIYMLQMGGRGGVCVWMLSIQGILPVETYFHMISHLIMILECDKFKFFGFRP